MTNICTKHVEILFCLSILAGLFTSFPPGDSDKSEYQEDNITEDSLTGRPQQKKKLNVQIRPLLCVRPSHNSYCVPVTENLHKHKKFPKIIIFTNGGGRECAVPVIQNACAYVSVKGHMIDC